MSKQTNWHIQPIGPDGLLPQGLTNVIVRPLSIIFEKLWQSADSCWLEEANVTFIFRKGKKDLLVNYRPASLTLIPEKVTEQLILKIISKQIKD